MAHTPGPWEIKQDEDGIYLNVGPRASRWDCADMLPSEEDEANAQLIVLAPEILEELRLCIRELSSFNLKIISERSGINLNGMFDRMHNLVARIDNV